jgi:hypothetical protein
MRFEAVNEFDNLELQAAFGYSSIHETKSPQLRDSSCLALCPLLSALSVLQPQMRCRLHCHAFRNLLTQHLER